MARFAEQFSKTARRLHLPVARCAKRAAIIVLCLVMADGLSGMPPLRCTGPANLNVLRAWSRVAHELIHAKDRAENYYDSIRFVYRLAARLKELDKKNMTLQPRWPRTARQSNDIIRSRCLP